jgi:transcriptional regulator with XRE-family HTH domain
LEATSKSLLPFIAAVVRTQRDARGWSQDELGGRAKVLPSQISFLERGKRSPKLPMLEGVSRAFGIPCSALIWQAEMLQARVEAETKAKKKR